MVLELTKTKNHQRSFLVCSQSLAALHQRRRHSRLNNTEFTYTMPSPNNPDRAIFCPVDIFTLQTIGRGRHQIAISVMRFINLKTNATRLSPQDSFRAWAFQNLDSGLQISIPVKRSINDQATQAPKTTCAAILKERTGNIRMKKTQMLHLMSPNMTE